MDRLSHIKKLNEMLLSEMPEFYESAAKRYSDFIKGLGTRRVLFLELGVGYNTPMIIKYPFWKLTAQNTNAAYACVNLGEAVCPDEIKDRAVLIDADIDEVLHGVSL